MNPEIQGNALCSQIPILSYFVEFSSSVSESVSADTDISILEWRCPADSTDIELVAVKVDIPEGLLTLR